MPGSVQVLVLVYLCGFTAGILCGIPTGIVVTLTWGLIRRRRHMASAAVFARELDEWVRENKAQRASSGDQ